MTNTINEGNAMKIRKSEFFKKAIARILSVLMIFSMISAGLAVTGVFVTEEVNAAVRGSEIRRGDIITLKSESWSSDYIVLDPVRANDGSPGMYVLLKNYEGKIPFNNTGSSEWEGSTAQKWCTTLSYYRNLPDPVKQIITGEEDKDKVFFLSKSEYSQYKNSAGIDSAENWWLRTAASDTEADIVTADGSLSYLPVTQSDVRARPAFNIDIPSDVCAEESRADGRVVWTVDVSSMGHAIDNISYTWSGGWTKCTAKASCGSCGESVTERVRTSSRTAEDGATVYEADFSGDFFEDQSRAVYADSVPYQIGEGDSLILKSGDWENEYIVLSPQSTNTGDDGTFLLQKTPGEKIMFDENGETNFWEGSTAQAWCYSYYNGLPDAVKDRVIGVKTYETDSDEFKWSEVNNIDGTKSDKDKVFFLSYMEYHLHKDSAGISAYDGVDHNEGQKWLLRAPGTDCSEYHDYISVVDNDGTVHNYSIAHMISARPAFNIDLSDLRCVTKEESGGITTWTADIGDAAHDEGTPEYKWADDKRSCTASMICGKCGGTVYEETVKTSSKVIKKPNSNEEGLAEYTAEFTGASFETQKKQAALPKTFVAGDILRVGGYKYKVLSAKSRTVTLVKSKNTKSVSVPASIKFNNKTLKVTCVEAKAFTGSKVRKVTMGKNVKKLKKNAFAGSKAGTVVLKTKLLTKSSVSGCMKSSKVKTVSVKVGTKADNAKYLKKYRKFFTKAVLGKAVKIK